MEILRDIKHVIRQLKPGLALVLLGVVVIGAAWLRFDGVGRQLIGGDELHTLQVARQESYWGILRQYSRFDNSVPMTLYARALIDSIGLTELRLRAPVMLSSLLLVAWPLLFRKELGTDATLGAALLLATSPPAIFFSIVARPYAPATLMLFLAVVSWWRWLGRQESRQALLLLSREGPPRSCTCSPRFRFALFLPSPLSTAGAAPLDASRFCAPGSSTSGCARFSSAPGCRA